MEASIRVMEQILESVTPSENSMSPTSVFEEKDVSAAVVKAELCYKWRFIGSPLIWNTWNDPLPHSMLQSAVNQRDNSSDALHLERQQRVFLGR